MDGNNTSAASTTQPVSAPYTCLTYNELQLAGQTEKRWICQGYLTPGEVTLLTSQWKSGKSTLISVLLSKMKSGGQLAGLPVAAGKAAVISEESPEQWFERGQSVPFADHLHWFCRPFRGKPSQEEWLALLAQIGRLHEEQHLDLLVVDPLANLTPMRSENDAGEMLNTLLPLQQLTSRGMGVVLLHHPRKGVIVPGQAARGSGALSGYVDIIIEMLRVSGRCTADRRRRLRAYSRHSITPDTLVIELTADGTDYLSLGTSAEPEFEYVWPILKGILERAERPLTRRDVLRDWPRSGAPPAAQTLWRWLSQAVTKEWVIRDGMGTRKAPHRYRLPGMEMKWHEAFLAALERKLESGPLPK